MSVPLVLRAVNALYISPPQLFLICGQYCSPHRYLPPYLPLTFSHVISTFCALAFEPRKKAPVSTSEDSRGEVHKVCTLSMLLGYIFLRSVVTKMHVGSAQTAQEPQIKDTKTYCGIPQKRTHTTARESSASDAHPPADRRTPDTEIGAAAHHRVVIPADEVVHMHTTKQHVKT